MPYGNKPNTPTTILTLPLYTDMVGEAILSKSFYRYWSAYNWLVEKTTKMWHQVRKMRVYKTICKQLEKTPKDKTNPERKALNIKRKEFLEAHGFSAPELEKMLKPYVKYWHLHSAIAQTIAARVYTAWNSFLYKKGRAVHFKRLDSFCTFAGKSNETGIMFINGDAPFVKFQNHLFQVSLRKGNTGWYQKEALKRRVKYCTLKREYLHGRWRYFVQLALEGIPPVKCDKNGVVKHSMNPGVVGLDIGTQTLAISGSDICDIRVLAPSAIAEAKNGITKEIARIQRAMDRSRKANNPEYFNADGTIKRLPKVNGQKQRRVWKNSNNYYRLLSRLRHLNHKLAVIRKAEHFALANELLEHGDVFYVEDMRYQALQKRSKETKVNSKTGRPRSKKRFGKSISRCAPAMFIAILAQKAKSYGGKVVKVDTFKTKASQFDHTSDEYTKKKLSQRMAVLSDGTTVQRDLYSAFLLAHVTTDLQSYNKRKIKKDFPDFLKLHEQTKKRLQSSHDWLPASIGF